MPIGLEQCIHHDTALASLARFLPVPPSFYFTTKVRIFPDDSAAGNFEKLPDWTPSLSSSLYRVDGWGPPYFAVNPSGNVSVRPHSPDNGPNHEIDLLELVRKVSEPVSSGGLGLNLPFTVRFPEMLKHQLESLQSAFDSAVVSQGYRSHYQGFYPVKCKQDRFIVEENVKFQSPFRFGLKAGSKAKLLLAMHCLCEGSPEAVLVCNGFKDAEYISLAVIVGLSLRFRG